jgi:Uma2 family endonuclease
VRLTTSGSNGDADIRTVVQPDICVVCDRAKLDDRGCLGAPDWIVEIVSPGNTDRDVRVKFELYQESGVREYWMVFPGLKNVAAYLLDGEKYRLVAEYTGPGPVPVSTLPGLVLEWEEIFAGD